MMTSKNLDNTTTDNSSTKKVHNYPIKDVVSIPLEEIVHTLQGDLTNGLAEGSINKRIKTYGLNRYEEQKQKSIFLLLIEQFKSPIILLLVLASGASLYFKDWLEGFAIIGVIFITAALGFFMELQARKSMNQLKSMDVSLSKVWRDNTLNEVPSEKLVPGDILVLEAGDMVLADARLVEINQFEVDESPLTGESMPITKTLEPLDKETSLADQTNMIFKGTSVIKGNAKAIIVGTALHTELGKITALVDNAKQVTTPLEKKLQGLTTKLMWLTAIFAAIFIITGFLQGKELYLIIETAIALAVAAIPEGLPVVSTIALTYGMLRMAEKKVLIKKLASVETLGGINTIFTDKTGTLTENKIQVNNISFFDNTFKVENNTVGEADAKANQASLEKILLISLLCNNAVVEKKEKKKDKQLGDPIEISLLNFVGLNNVNISQIQQEYPRIAEEAFSSETKLMGTLHKKGDTNFVAVKGAIEAILQQCKSFYKQGEIVSLTEEDKNQFLQKAEEIQAQGTRVLGFAFNEANNIPNDNMVKELTFVGFIGFLDPPRLDISGALQSCRNAGIKVIMITGDHPATALNIAQTIQLSDTENVVLTGKDLEGKPDKKQLFAATIFARVTPQQKLDMVTLYQKRGDIVAMTGDGINDAPALKKAEIGIAMGKRGTQVAIETAEMVLKNDSFKSIVVAIEQGRVIFQNIKRFLVYLLSCNLSEIVIVFLYGLLNFPFSVLPLQILFLNLVTDIFPALALGMGKGNKLIMSISPRNPKEPIVVKQDWINILVYASLLALPIIGVTWYCSVYLQMDAKICNNITFFSLAFSQLWHVFNLSSRKISFFKNEITENKFVWAALGLCIVIMLTFYWVSPLNKIIGLQKLDFTIWSIILITSWMPVVLVQLFKRVFKVIS